MQIFSSARLPHTVQKPARTGFLLNNRKTIDINCVFKRFQPLHYCSRRREPSTTNISIAIFETEIDIVAYKGVVHM